MKSKLLGGLAVAVGVLVVSLPVFAHHAGSLYDREHPVTMTGTVTEYMFTNPHVQIHFEAKDESGNVVKWVAESAPPQRLYRAGWNMKSLKAGDQITVSGAPYKDGRKLLSIRKLVSPSGQTLGKGPNKKVGLPVERGESYDN